jgi:hypothetical protein
MSLQIPDVSYVDISSGETLNKLCWSKASLNQVECYKVELYGLLKDIECPIEALKCKNYNCIIHRVTVEAFHDDIVDACIAAGKKCIPRVDNEQSRKIIPGWNDNAKYYYLKALFWHKIWKQTGCPAHGHVFETRKYTRHKYHEAVKLTKKQSELSRASNMANYILENRSRDFWGEVRKVKNSGKSVNVHTVDNVIGEAAIADVFGFKYKELYNSVQYSANDLDDLKSVIDVCLEHDHKAGNYFQVVKEDVEKAIKHLKRGKNDGQIGLTTDHFINGTEKLNNYMTMLFNAMMIHGFAPKEFLTCTIISIPKDKRKSMNNSDNYRGIAMSSICGKILDWVLLCKLETPLQSSDLQFGFKAKHSTAPCTYVVNEVVQYYNN